MLRPGSALWVGRSRTERAGLIEATGTALRARPRNARRTPPGAEPAKGSRLEARAGAICYDQAPLSVRVGHDRALVQRTAGLNGDGHGARGAA